MFNETSDHYEYLIRQYFIFFILTESLARLISFLVYILRLIKIIKETAYLK